MAFSFESTTSTEFNFEIPLTDTVLEDKFKEITIEFKDYLKLFEGNYALVNSHYIMEFKENHPLAIAKRMGKKDEEDEKESQALYFGKLVDEMLNHNTLEIFSTCDNKPSSSQSIKFCREVLNGYEHRVAYNTNYAKYSDKEADATYAKYKEYISKMRAGKKIITNAEFELLNEILEAHKVNPLVKDYCKKGDANNIFTFHDLTLKTKVEDFSTYLELICRVDKIIVNKNNKKIYIIDYKTSSKSGFKEFERDMYYRKYQVQAAFYKIIVKEILKGTEFEEYHIESLLEVIRNKKPTHVELFMIGDDLLKHGTSIIEEFFELFDGCNSVLDHPHYYYNENIDKTEPKILNLYYSSK